MAQNISFLWIDKQKHKTHSDKIRDANESPSNASAYWLVKIIINATLFPQAARNLYSMANPKCQCSHKFRDDNSLVPVTA